MHGILPPLIWEMPNIVSYPCMLKYYIKNDDVEKV